jgi:hypothetical protein
MGKYFNNKEQGPTYYIVCGTILAVTPLPAFWIGYECVKAGEYWPLIWCVTIIGLAWLSAYYLFQTARKIKQFKNRPEDEIRNDGEP